jgi:predicted O-methyltransferase YrrM
LAYLSFRYSTIWLAKAIPEDGRIVTCEIEEAHIKASLGDAPCIKYNSPTSTQAAKQNFHNANLSHKITLLEGPALDSLKALQVNHDSRGDSEAPFDLAFIDADKQNNTNYFIEAKRLVRKGGVIVSCLDLN